MTDRMLMEHAKRAMKYALAGTSGHRVGAALIAVGGGIHTGCNIEPQSLHLNVCAERLAVYKALAAGARGAGKIAVVSDVSMPCMPCGSCRQLLHEYFPEIVVITENRDGRMKRHRVKDLLPHAFEFKPGRKKS